MCHSNSSLDKLFISFLILGLCYFGESYLVVWEGLILNIIILSFMFSWIQWNYTTNDASSKTNKLGIRHHTLQSRFPSRTFNRTPCRCAQEIHHTNRWGQFRICYQWPWFSISKWKQHHRGAWFQSGKMKTWPSISSLVQFLICDQKRSKIIETINLNYYMKNQKYCGHQSCIRWNIFIT